MKLLERIRKLFAKEPVSNDPLIKIIDDHVRFGNIRTWAFVNCFSEYADRRDLAFAKFYVEYNLGTKELRLLAKKRRKKSKEYLKSKFPFRNDSHDISLAFQMKNETNGEMSLDFYALAGFEHPFVAKVIEAEFEHSGINAKLKYYKTEKRYIVKPATAADAALIKFYYNDLFDTIDHSIFGNNSGSFSYFGQTLNNSMQQIYSQVYSSTQNANNTINQNITWVAGPTPPGVTVINKSAFTTAQNTVPAMQTILKNSNAILQNSMKNLDHSMKSLDTKVDKMFTDMDDLFDKIKWDI